MSGIEIKPLSASPNTSEALCAMMIEVVANNGSVSFMHPLEPERARAFWDAAPYICMGRTWRKFARLQCVPKKRELAGDAC